MADSEIEEPEEFCANIVSDDPRIQSLGGECDVTITILDTSKKIGKRRITLVLIVPLSHV